MEQMQKKLNCEWSFWYASRKEKDHHIPYDMRLTEMASFNTLDQFFKIYLFIKPIYSIERNHEIGLFKKEYKPLWENCPDSGYWFYRFKSSKDGKEINYKWEKVLFSLIGEQFDEANILGAILSIRGKETIIELWFNYFGHDKIKNKVASKFREILSNENGETIYFKDNKKSLMDKSTLRNAETYSFERKRKFTYN